MPVAFYLAAQNGNQLLGTVATVGQILPGAAETVVLSFAPPGPITGPYTIYVVVDDDGKGQGVVNECDENNNASAPLAVGCPRIG